MGIHIFATDHESQMKKAVTTLVLVGDYKDVTLSDVNRVLPGLIAKYRMPKGENLSVNVNFSFTFNPELHSALNIEVRMKRPCSNDVIGEDFQRKACGIIFEFYNLFSNDCQNLVIETTGLGAITKDLTVHEVMQYGNYEKAP